MATFQMGPGTLEIPMSLFLDNRIKLANVLKVEITQNVASTYVLLEGGKDKSLYDTDVEYVFRQESYFQYLFGVRESGCYGAVNVATGQSALFVPRLPEDYAVWMGNLHSLEDFKKMYEVDEVFYVDQSGTNSDSGLSSSPATFKGIEKPGKSEYQGESEFLHHSYSVGGCRHASYTCICGSGINSAVLHYGHANAPNDRLIKDGDMCLFDMGANYGGYAADITCSFPANGKFTDDQKYIYNSVLNARTAAFKMAKDGVSWVDVHRKASEALLRSLKDGGMLQGCVNEMIAAGLGGIFQPHGLGHLLGLDVHDVGGYIKNQPSRPTEPGFTKLRFARILKAGMYVTIEPGCYFIDCLMDKALATPELNKFIIKSVFERFRNFGGVRIEDDVLITKNGNENFSIVPRTVEEIEDWMSS